MHTLVEELLENGLWDESNRVRVDVVDRCVRTYAPPELVEDFIATAVSVAQAIFDDGHRNADAAALFVRRVLGDVGAACVTKGVAGPGRAARLNFVEARQAAAQNGKRVGPARAA